MDTWFATGRGLPVVSLSLTVGLGVPALSLTEVFVLFSVRIFDSYVESVRYRLRPANLNFRGKLCLLLGKSLVIVIIDNLVKRLSKECVVELISSRLLFTLTKHSLSSHPQILHRRSVPPQYFFRNSC